MGMDMGGELTATEKKALDAAGRLFAERGYKGTTTRAIAALAGVNEVTLFRLFKNKAGILRAFGRMLAESSAGGTAEKLPDPGNVRETLESLARLETESTLKHGGAAIRLAFEAASVPEVSDVVGDGMRNNLQRLSAYIAKCQANGDLRKDIASDTLAGAFFSLTSSYVMFRMITGPGSMFDEEEVKTVVKGLVDVFFSGAAAGKELLAKEITE
jgi:AcrR family transcriptional regulator